MIRHNASNTTAGTGRQPAVVGHAPTLRRERNRMLASTDRPTPVQTPRASRISSASSMAKRTTALASGAKAALSAPMIGTSVPLIELGNAIQSAAGHGLRSSGVGLLLSAFDTAATHAAEHFGIELKYLKRGLPALIALVALTQIPSGNTGLIYDLGSAAGALTINNLIDHCMNNASQLLVNRSESDPGFKVKAIVGAVLAVLGLGVAFAENGQRAGFAIAEAGLTLSLSAALDAAALFSSWAVGASDVETQATRGVGTARRPHPTEFDELAAGPGAVLQRPRPTLSRPRNLTDA